MATAKMGLSGLNSVETADKARGIHDKMDGNPLFPAADPTPADMQKDIDELVAANAEVSNNGGKAAYQARKVAERKVRANVKKWLGYVQMASGGDRDAILSSGLGVVERGTAYPLPSPPMNVNARLTRTANIVSLYWDRQAGVDMHHVFMSRTNAPYAWELVGATTKSRFEVKNLPSGEERWFAVSAIGAAGESTLSDVFATRAA